MYDILEIVKHAHANDQLFMIGHLTILEMEVSELRNYYDCY